MGILKFSIVEMDRGIGYLYASILLTLDPILMKKRVCG
jgi:hypothetical protein